LALSGGVAGKADFGVEKGLVTFYILFFDVWME
jgi:hypothetical protein